MADPDKNKSLLVTGRLSYGCTDLSAAWPHGGTGLGLVGSIHFEPPAGVVRLPAEEDNASQELLYVGGDAVLGASLEGWDDSVAGGVLAPLFPSRLEVGGDVVLEWPGSLTTAPNATQVAASGGRTLTYNAAAHTITASSGSFVSDGFAIGMLVTSAGTTSNNFSGLALTGVSATVLTFGSGIANEGPLSSAATLNATTPGRTRRLPGELVPTIKLVFTPIDATHPAVILYRAAPMLEASAQLRLSAIRTLSVPLLFVGTPDTNGRVAASGRLSRLSL